MTAGGLLRAAREKQGLHIAALAASIKVAPRKLDALENDRWDELSGAIFTRALAQSVCRALRVDATPILALLPPAKAVDLDHVAGRLNAPFRDRSARDEGALAAIAQRSLIWAGGLLFVAAVVTFLLPPSWLQFERAPVVAAPAAASAVALAVAPTASAPVSNVVPALTSASTATPALAASAPVPAPAQVEVTHGAPVLALAVSAPGAMSPAASPASAAAALQLSASDVSWVEVRDGAGRILLSRNVQRGETIGVDGVAPLRLTIGNAAVTRVVFRGKPVDVTAGQRDNVARLELN